MKRLNMMKKQAGFSMVELLMVFAVILGAAVLVFVAYPKVKDNQAAATENTNLSTLQAGIKSLYSGKSNFAGVTPTVLLNAQVVPNTMINGANIVNTWGQTVTIASASLGGVPNNAYSISYSAVPQGPCVKLVSAAGLNFDTVSVNSTAIKTFGNSDIDIAALAGACAGGGTANTILMTGR